MLPLEDGEPIDSVEDEDDILDAELCGKFEFIIIFVTDIVTQCSNCMCMEQQQQIQDYLYLNIKAEITYFHFSS